LRFFFVKVLRRPYREIDLVYPKRPERLPLILSEEEVARLIESASTSYHRVILMTLYGTGLRREELCRLKVTDVDSQRMVIHVRQGKGNKDRDITLSPRLLDVLRAYWKWRKPFSPVPTDHGRSDRLIPKPCGMPCVKLLGVQGSRKRCLRICCDTAGQHTFWNAGPI